MKTGGTFVKQCIENLHLPASQNIAHEDYSISVDKQPPDTLFFTVVRHPVSWYRSFWRYRQEVGWGGDLAIGHGPYINDNFEDWVRVVTQEYPGYLTELYSRYIGDCVIVLKQESLITDLEVLFGDTRIRNQPYANVTKVPCNHTEETIRLILKSEQKVLDMFYEDIR
jgi:hypothetical protein